MAPRKRPWFRFYVEACTDPKLRRLKPEERWLWVCVLAASRQSPEPGVLMLTDEDPIEAADLADLAGMRTAAVSAGLAKMKRLGLVSLTETGAFLVPKWAERQYESDDANKRSQRRRKGLTSDNANDATSMQRGIDGQCNVHPPTQRQSTETETETDNQSLSLVLGGSDQGSRDAVVVAAVELLVERAVAAHMPGNPDAYRAASYSNAWKNYGDHLAEAHAEHPHATPDDLLAVLEDERYLA